MTQLDNLYEIILRSTYQLLRVLVFHTCLYSFTFLANNSHFLSKICFQNDALYESRDHGHLIIMFFCRLIYVVIFDIIDKTFTNGRATYVTSKSFFLGNIRKIIK